MDTMDVKIYEAHADKISVDDIATDSNNRFVLRRMKNNNANDYDDELYIQNRHDEDGEDCVDYVPEGAGDMGWLGYFVGKNEHLKQLVICHFTPPSGTSARDVLGPFFRGVCSNKSIRQISFSGVDLLGGDAFTILTPFFKNNQNLINIDITFCGLGGEGARLFALALGNCTNKSLQRVVLERNNISEEGMVDILTALSIHPHLHHLDLNGNRLRKNGCVALATLLRCSATELQYLYISRNEIGDGGIEILVPALTTCSHLEELYLPHNPSITARGWQSLASILESSNSNLPELFIADNNIDDDAVASFANALMNNYTLQTLHMNGNPSITAEGWQSFSKLLCNTSSVNSTFLSNHTLNYLGNEGTSNAIIGHLLRLNRRDDKKEVATIKILQNHDDFDMLPFFEWEFTFLPLVLSWLERASTYEMPADFEPNIEPMKLSTIYQFVRGMPLLYVETRLRKELKDIKAEESQMEEEESQEEEFMQRKQLLQERKESIMKKLGGRKFTT